MASLKLKIKKVVFKRKIEGAGGTTGGELEG